MATGTTWPIYGNRECLFRLQTLIIDGGTEVIRNLFDQNLHGVPLSDVLACEENTIKILKQRRMITEAKYSLLYPPVGQPPKSKDFDITLLIWLLRNLPSLGLKHNYTWDVPPHPTDLSIEADLCRLVQLRNDVSFTMFITKFMFMLLLLHDKINVQVIYNIYDKFTYLFLLRSLFVDLPKLKTNCPSD